jgi:hypothetical protein
MPYADSIEMVNDYIRRFGHAVAVELHPLDADGYTDLRHDQLVIGINANVEHNVLLILVKMGELPAVPVDDATLFRRLLELNFLATRSCCFAIDEQRRRIYLRAMRGLEGLDYQEFAELLETVAVVAKRLRKDVPELCV